MNEFNEEEKIYRVEFIDEKNPERSVITAQMTFKNAELSIVSGIYPNGKIFIDDEIY